MTLLSECDPGAFASVRYVLTDIDDTLTKDGKVELPAFRSIWSLADAGIHVVPVTGRPAGWCDCIARQWPVAGVVGENGAFAFYESGGALKHIYHPATEGGAREVELQALAERVLSRVPGTRIAKDQFARKFDVAIDFREEEPKLGYEVAREIKRICEEGGAHAKISSIHVNAWFGDYDKLSMSEQFLASVFDVDLDRDAGTVVFCGDSPNDEPMFARFPLSVAVANIDRFVADLEFPPAIVCSRAHGSGFAELVDVILSVR